MSLQDMVKVQVVKDTYQWENWKEAPAIFKQTFTSKDTTIDYWLGTSSTSTKKDYTANTTVILEASLVMVEVMLKPNT